MDSNLSESDARTICTRVTAHLVQMGATVQAIGVHLDEEGFWFSAVINGEQVWVRRGEGNWEYATVAADLYGSALEGRLAQFEEAPKDGQQPLTARPLAERKLNGESARD
jgi:hypothetical protein